MYKDTYCENTRVQKLLYKITNEHRYFQIDFRLISTVVFKETVIDTNCCLFVFFKNFFSALTAALFLYTKPLYGREKQSYRNMIREDFTQMIQMETTLRVYIILYETYVFKGLWLTFIYRPSDPRRFFVCFRRLHAVSY